MHSIGIIVVHAMCRSLFSFHLAFCRAISMLKMYSICWAGAKGIQEGCEAGRSPDMQTHKSYILSPLSTLINS